MDKQIKNKILEILKQNNKSLLIYEIYKKTKEFSQDKVDHIIDVLTDDGIIKRTQSNLSPITGEYLDFVELTSKGYSSFKTPYKKFLDFISNDLLKILTIVSIILSITATIISLLR